MQRIQEIFEDQAERTPNAVAVEFGDRHLTYATLNRQANELANRLLRRGGTPGSPVALLIERSPEMVGAFLGILKAGGVCVPLDISGPSERQAFVIRDAGIRLLVTSQALAHQTPRGVDRILYRDSETSEASEGLATNPRRNSGSAAAAYVIYTSGSTGMPKGVIGSHASLLNGLYWMWGAYPFEQSDVCCHTTIFQSTIDSIWEMFLPLLKGVRLSIIPDGIIRDPPRLIDALNEKRVTRIALVPSLLRLLLESCDDLGSRLPVLWLWMSSGEPLGCDLAEGFLRALPATRLLNLYGLSEAPDVTYFDVRSASKQEGSMPIGLPVSNVSVYLLDLDKNLVLAGEPGELHLGGPALAIGYLGRPELTAERFIPDRIGDTPGGRLYNTGDMARYSADGNLEFLSRLDSQVKIHGLRVEIGEVEGALAQHPAVKQGVVVARGDNPDKVTLAAYILPEEERQPTAHELRSYLTEKIPYYMIPSEFMNVSRIPLTRSGKVDRQALARIRPPKESRQLIPPRDVLELQLAGIWEDVLKTGPVSVTDNFFDLGGDSLSAISLVCKMEEQIGELLPLSVLIEAGSIADLSKLLTEKTGPLPYKPLATIRKAGPRPPLFLVHGIGGEVLEFHDLARHLGPDQPFYGLQAPLATPSVKENRSIEEVATEYLEAIREVQPDGSYFLGGYSWGGMVAFEIAQQLSAQNQEVGLLALLDTEIGASGATPQILYELGDMIKDKEHLLLDRDLVSAIDPEGQFRDELERLALALSAENITEELGKAYMHSYARGFIARMKAGYRYHPQTFAGKITLFRADNSQLQYGWDRLTTMPLEVYEIPGDHWGILREPYVKTLATVLRQCIDYKSCKELV
jgi:amino acid adenylation domain-containing protein